MTVLWQDMTFRKYKWPILWVVQGILNQNILSSKIFCIKEDNEIVEYFKNHVLMCIIYDYTTYIGFILLKKLLQRNLSLDLKNTICHGKGEGDMRIEKNMFVYVKAASRFEHGVYFFQDQSHFFFC